MKKIILIFVAAVALSSVAASALFAEEKYRHTEQIGAETVTTDVVVTEVSPLEIKFKVRKELVSSKVTLYFETAAKYENNLFVYNCVDNFGNDVHGDVRLRSDGTALLLLFTFYPSKIDESIRVFYTQGQILLESMEQPPPVFKSEGITFDGSEWYHARFADKEGITQAFMKNMPVVITVKFDDGREGRIWTECDENSEVFIPNLSDEFKDCKFSIEIDNERWEELCKIQKAKAEEQKSRVALGEKRGEILSPSPVRWTFSDKKVEITVEFGCGYPEADEMKIKLDYKKSKYKFYAWQGKYAATDSHIELFVTDYTEGYKDGVGGYGSLTDYCELSYSLDGGTLTIHTPLSDVLDSADKLEKGYRFPVPLVLTKVDTQ